MSAPGEKFKIEMSDHYVRFVDIIFGFTTVQGIALAASPERYGVWFANLPSNVVNISNFLLVYVLLISSWLGYHSSVNYYPIRSAKRFVVDIILVLLYYIGFVFAGNFLVILFVITITFFLYFLWDWLRIYEYEVIPEDKYAEKQDILKEFRRRRKLSLVYWLITFAVLVIYIVSSILIPSDQVVFLSGIFTLILWFTLIHYRIVKKHND